MLAEITELHAPSLGHVTARRSAGRVDPLPEAREDGPERRQALLLGALGLRGIGIAPMHGLSDAGEDGQAPRASSHTVIT